MKFGIGVALSVEPARDLELEDRFAVRFGQNSKGRRLRLYDFVDPPGQDRSQIGFEFHFDAASFPGAQPAIEPETIGLPAAKNVYIHSI